MNVEIAVPLKYLSNFLRTLEIPLVNYEINLILTWSAKVVITNSAGQRTFKITNVKLYLSVVTLSTQVNAGLLQLLQQPKSGFKRTVNWNKYQSKVTIQATKP